MASADVPHLGRLLVVDDHPDSVTVVAEYFTHAGYEVFGAHNGRDALGMVDQHRPDVVLLDIRMPGMSGVEVLQQIRLRWRALPVVMVSGADDVELARSCLRRGALDYVRKPFDFDNLHRAVAAAAARAATGEGPWASALEPTSR
jgi:DNA-binding response OmpR family regulator